MKKLKNILIIILVLALSLSLFVLYVRYSKGNLENKTTISSDIIEEKLSKILELSTVKYNYTNVVAYKDSVQFKGINIPFSSKSFLVKYNGYVKAGIDLASLNVEVLDEESIRVTMDKALIFDNVINEDEIYIYDEKESIFNKFSFSDFLEVLTEEKTKIEDEVKEKGLLGEAEKNAIEIIKSLLETMDFVNVEVITK